MDTEGIRRSVAARLKELQWSRARLARESGVDPNTISDFLNGKRQPSSVTLSKLELALELTPGTPGDSGEDELGESPPSGYEYEWVARRPTAMGRVSVSVTLNLARGVDSRTVQPALMSVVQSEANALLDAVEVAARQESAPPLAKALGRLQGVDDEPVATPAPPRSLADHRRAKVDRDALPAETAADDGDDTDEDPSI